jgi:hypothetical protein
MNKFSKVRDLVMSLEGDFEKFYEKGNSAAGTRVRKGMQDLKNLAQDLRKEVQDMKNSGSGEGGEGGGGTAKKAAAGAKGGSKSKK